MPRSRSSLFPDESNPANESNEFIAQPQNQWVIAHCDGGARGNPGPAGYGVILQDESGDVLAKLSEFLGHRTNNFAEYSGLLGCLQWALDHGRPRLRVVSDSELMVKQIQGKYKVNSPDLRPLWEEARRRIAKLERFEITHELRHKNKAADQLANEAMDRGTGRSLAGVPTASIPWPKAALKPVAATRSTNSSSLPTASPPTSPPASSPASMLRGFTRGGVIHLLGDAALPEGVFVKILPE